MKGFLFAVVMIAAVSCGLTEVGEPVRRPGGEAWTGPGMNVGKDDPDRTICYVTLMSYSDGYDWRADREKGSVKCSLVVLANGLPMMKVPVGDEYETSSDPDMHRMIDGHLYTDYSTDSESVIKKDGRQLFRYSGKAKQISSPSRYSLPKLLPSVRSSRISPFFLYVKPSPSRRCPRV